MVQKEQTRNNSQKVISILEQKTNYHGNCQIVSANIEMLNNMPQKANLSSKSFSAAENAA